MLQKRNTPEAARARPAAFAWDDPFRLDEQLTEEERMIRDAALQASGLLNPAIGGPPIRPYQPAGVWQEIFMGRFTYEPSVGAAQFRRTVYAFWRRSSAPERH